MVSGAYGTGCPALHQNFLYWTILTSQSLSLKRIDVDRLEEGAWYDVSWSQGHITRVHAFLTVDDSLYLLCETIQTNNNVLYQMVGDEWQVVSQLPGDRRNYMVQGVLGSKLFIIGGETASQARVCETLSLDLRNVSAGWQREQSIPSASYMGAAVSEGNKLHVIGSLTQSNESNPTEIMTLATDSALGYTVWTSGVLQQTPLTRSGACLVNGHIVVAGGMVPLSSPSGVATVKQPCKSVFVHSNEVKEWLPLPDLNVRRYAPRLLYNGKKLICLGGRRSGRRCREIEVLQLQCQPVLS